MHITTDLQPNFMIIEDDLVFAKRLVSALNKRGFASTSLHHKAEAYALHKEDLPECIIIDLCLGDDAHAGLQLVKHIKALEPNTDIVVLTGYGSIATAVEAIKYGAKNYLTKPADVDDLLAAFFAPSYTSDTQLFIPSLARMEWEHIQRVLTLTGYNITETARLLNLHRRSLQRKLKHTPPTL